MLYSITLESNNRFMDYSPLSAAIASLGESKQILRQTWLLHAMTTVDQIFKAISPHFDQQSDRLFISEITGHRMNGWMSRDQWDWANSHNR